MHEDQRAGSGVSAGRDELATVATLHARDLIVLLDPSGIILWASPSHLDVLGHETANMIGRRNIEFLHPADLDRVVEALRERITDRTFPSQEKTIVNAIVTMGHPLGLRVVAEGVEHPEQRVILRELPCDEM